MIGHHHNGLGRVEPADGLETDITLCDAEKHHDGAMHQSADSLVPKLLRDREQADAAADDAHNHGPDGESAVGDCGDGHAPERIGRAALLGPTRNDEPEQDGLDGV